LPEPPVFGRENTSHCGTFERALLQVTAAPGHRDSWTDVLRRVRPKSPRHHAVAPDCESERGRSKSLACLLARKPPRLIAWVSTPLPRGTFGPGIRTSTRQGRFLRRKLKPPECRSAAVGRDASWLLRQSRFVHSPVLTGRRKMAYRCGLRVTPTRCRVHRERFMVGSFGSELG